MTHWCCVKSPWCGVQRPVVNRFHNTDRESSSLAIKNGGGVVSLYDPDVGKVRNVYFLVRYISSNVATDEDKGREWTGETYNLNLVCACLCVDASSNKISLLVRLLLLLPSSSSLKNFRVGAYGPIHTKTKNPAVQKGGRVLEGLVWVVGDWLTFYQDRVQHRRVVLFSPVLT